MVPISPNIYSGAAVVMDNRSLFDYIQKLEDRRLKRQLAEQDAINDYLKNTSKDIDYKGIRATDINNFQKKLAEFRGISDEFRRNPRDLNKRLELDRKADDLRLFVQKSKEAKEVDKEYANFLRQVNTNRELRKTTNLKRVMQDKAIHDLPIEFEVPILGISRPDDTSPKLDYYKPAPINTYDLVEKNLKGVSLGVATRVTPTDKDYYYTAEQRYTPEGIKIVSERIKKQISSDPDLIASYEVKGQQLDPKTQAEYTIALKRYYPDMEVDEEDGLSVGLAEAILEMEGRKKDIRQFDKKAYDRFKSSLIEGRQKAGGAGVDLLDYDILGKYTPQVVNIVKPSATAEEREAIPTEVVFEKDIPSEDLELITNKGEVGAITEKGMKPYFKVRSDGNWEGSQGKVIDRSLVARSNLDKTSLAEERRLRQGLIKTTAPKVPATTKKKGELD